jgi:hypothetical protein
MQMFDSISSKKIVALISESQQRVILSAPGIHVDVANSLVVSRKKLGVDKVTVVLDTAEDVCRLGYGHIDAIKILIENGFVVRQSPGLRVGVLICDENSWVFSPTALYIEDEPQSFETPNSIQLPPSIAQHLAIRLSEHELTKAIQDQESVARNLVTQLTENEPPKAVQDPVNQTPPLPEIDIPQEIEVGRFALTPTEFREVSKNLEIAPPVAFNIARQVRVYQPYIQYVDIELKNAAIQRKRIELPASVVNLGSGAEIEERISTQFSLFEKNKELSSKPIDKKLKIIRDDYTRSLGKHGRFLLRSRRRDFDKEVIELQSLLKVHQENIEKNLKNFLDEAVKTLVEYYKPHVMKNPPQSLKGQITEDKPDDAVAEKWLRKQLEGVFPSSDDILKNMELLVQYKDVTNETLQDEEFQDKIKKAFEYVDWEKPFKEFLAISEDDKQKHKKDV